MSKTDKTTPRIRGTTPKIEAAARRLRKNMTPAERKLWEALRGKKLAGLKFRAQHPVGRFVLDFYCPACKLVIEVDGDAHDETIDYDRVREEHLQDYGYQVIRFRNDEVLNDLTMVIEKILEAARELTPQPSQDPEKTDSPQDWGAGGRSRVSEGPSYDQNKPNDKPRRSQNLLR